MAPYIQGGFRGGKVLIDDDGFRYHLNRTTAAGRMHFRCWRATCRAYLHCRAFELDAPGVEIDVLGVDRHSHPADTTMVNHAAITQVMLSAIKVDPSKSIKQVYDDVVRQAGVTDVPEFKSVRSRLQRNRRSLLPRLPLKIADVAVEGVWRCTWSGARFLSLIDNEAGVLVFAPDENYQRLYRCDDVYIDGTFKTAPKPYCQFVTVHGKYINRIVPLIFCVLSGKLESQYQRVLQHISQKVLNLTGRVFQPTRVVTDFELALLNAIEKELPNSRRSACYFHFTQSLWRKVQALKLAVPYTKDADLKECIRKCMSLGFLPHYCVRPNFQSLAKAKKTTRIVRRHPTLRTFLVYMRKTYIAQRSAFPPELWNIYDLNERTNNTCESFHGRWNSKLRRVRPSLWVFLTQLKDEQLRTELALKAAVEGFTGPPKKRKWRDLDARIARLQLEFRGKIRNLDEYWTAIQNCVHNFIV